MKPSVQEGTAPAYLACERRHTFLLLMMAGGYLGAFTYNLRGGVFCNAQTANFVLMAMALGRGQLAHAAYLLIPIGAYLAGAVLSEALPLLVGIEALVVLVLGLLPETAPYQISQVAINFICSMQYNTFRQAEGIPMATTFCTNHLRQTGIHLTKCMRHRSRAELGLALSHIGMLAVFVAGGAVCTVLCPLFLGRTIWGAALLLAVVFANLLYADLRTERGLLSRKPAGH